MKILICWLMSLKLLLLVVVIYLYIDGSSVFSISQFIIGTIIVTFFNGALLLSIIEDIKNVLKEGKIK